jgi:hypothetical protein
MPNANRSGVFAGPGIGARDNHNMNSPVSSATFRGIVAGGWMILRIASDGDSARRLGPRPAMTSPSAEARLPISHELNCREHYSDDEEIATSLQLILAHTARTTTFSPGTSLNIGDHHQYVSGCGHQRGSAALCISVAAYQSANGRTRRRVVGILASTRRGERCPR